MLENISDVLIAHAHLAHDSPGFADGAHHAMLDAIVDHLDVVSRASLAHDAHTRPLVLVFCRDALQKR
jgi:hypothetical protein